MRGWHPDYDVQDCKATSFLPLLLLTRIFSLHLEYVSSLDTKSHPNLLAFALRKGVSSEGEGVAEHSVRNFQLPFALSLTSRDISCFKVAFQITKGENRASGRRKSRNPNLSSKYSHLNMMGNICATISIVKRYKPYPIFEKRRTLFRYVNSTSTKR